MNQRSDTWNSEVFGNQASAYVDNKVLLVTKCTCLLAMSLVAMALHLVPLSDIMEFDIVVSMVIILAWPSDCCLLKILSSNLIEPCCN